MMSDDDLLQYFERKTRVSGTTQEWAALREIKRLKADLKTLIECRVRHLQACHICPNTTCGDNTAETIQNELRSEIKRLRDELQRAVEKLSVMDEAFRLAVRDMVRYVDGHTKEPTQVAMRAAYVRHARENLQQQIAQVREESDALLGTNTKRGAQVETD